MSSESYCSYYTARVEKKECWFFVAVLRSFEHLAFDRTVDKATSTFEMFVPAGNEPLFVELMADFQNLGVIHSFEKRENRLKLPNQEV